MIFEHFANYGWTKEYIIKNMTYKQVKLYLQAFYKKKEIEYNAMVKSMGSGVSQPESAFSGGIKPMQDFELLDFGLSHDKGNKK